MQSRNLFFAVALCAVAGCQEDLTEQKAAWSVLTQGWATKLDRCHQGHAALVEKMKGVTVPETEPALVADKAALDKSVETGANAVADAEKAVAAAKTSIEALIVKGKKVQLEVALSNTRSVDGELAKALSLVSASNEALDMLQKKTAAAKAAADAAKSRSEAWAGEIKKRGGLLNIDDLTFRGAAVDAENSKVALISLLATLKACPELRVEVTVTAVTDEVADLGAQRAEALKTLITGSGVDAAVLSKIVGTVVAEGEEKVAVAVNVPCK